jgi:carbamoyltransferase
MRILGINYFFEHTSVAILEDGVLMFSAEEERFNKIKGGKRYSPYSLQLPFRAIYAGLKYLDIMIGDIDAIAFSYNKWQHLFGCFSTKRWSFYDDIIASGGLFHLKRALCSEYETFQYMSD